MQIDILKNARKHVLAPSNWSVANPMFLHIKPAHSCLQEDMKRQGERMRYCCAIETECWNVSALHKPSSQDLADVAGMKDGGLEEFT